MYSVVDIEGNGGGFRKESIIEVAIYKYDGHKIVDQFISMVNPEGEITPFVQKLTGITPNMVKTAPKFHEIAKREHIDMPITEEVCCLINGEHTARKALEVLMARAKKAESETYPTESL